MPETFITSFNQKLNNVHDYGTCAGEFCVIHKWSNHAMVRFPQFWREDKKMMDRVCPHGVGHPDPDEYRLDLGNRGVHDCDGCCSPVVELDHELNESD